MDIVVGLRAFVLTATAGSFTTAAKQMGISNRLTSKYVAELEERLGTRLFQRTTRRVGLTPPGELLLEKAPGLLNALDSLIAEVSEDKAELSGTLRVSAPFILGESYVQDMLSRFAQQHPSLTVDLRLSDAHVDLAADAIDLAFRIGDAGMSSLKQRKLGEIQSIIVASPDYLADNEVPETLDDLRSHTCIVDTNNRAAERWAFIKDNDRKSVSVPTRFMVNSAKVARELALKGRGITYGPLMVVKEDIDAGRLIRLLPQYDTPRHSLNVTYLEGRTVQRKVRALIEFAVRDIKTFPIV
jgi:DNA-binding transcriptional LysR family regulator